MKKSKFIIVEHHAKRAGKHFDLRFRLPDSDKWASFAGKKEPPKEPGTKIMLVRTLDHTEEEALFIGTIESGYGAGTLKKWDGGSCEIHKYERGKHIVVDFKGRKIKGIYHFISTKVLRGSKSTNKEQYMFFKGKLK